MANKSLCVFVLNQRGEPLMPCSPQKARKLLEENKATIHHHNPFTIQLNYATGETTQNVSLGIDSGAKHIGIAVTSENKVLTKGEVKLRDDISENLKTKAMYRRSRRYRKTRYREARFLNRKKPQGWLPPSINSQVQSTYKWIDKFLKVLPNPQLHIESTKFDIAKMINPDIQGVDYQKGLLYQYKNVKSYVLQRDNYTCQLCGKKDRPLCIHHIIFRSEGGTNRPDNLITLCSDCHTSKNHQKGGKLWEWCYKDKKTVKQYKEPPFMNIINSKLKKKYPNAEITYGYITDVDRKEDLHLEKTHYNDAITISGIKNIKENPDQYFFIKQIRKKKRSLHEANARKGTKEPNRTQYRRPRNVIELKGYRINDKVTAFGKVGYITGFSGTTNVCVKNQEGNIQDPNRKDTVKNISISKIKKICSNGNWQYYTINTI